MKQKRNLNLKAVIQNIVGSALAFVFTASAFAASPTPPGNLNSNGYNTTNKSDFIELAQTSSDDDLLLDVDDSDLLDEDDGDLHQGRRRSYLWPG
jgi:hypothetical protein